MTLRNRFAGIMLAAALLTGAGIPLLLQPHALRAALPTNSWLGLRTFEAATGTMGRCQLGAASYGSGRASVWAAVTGSASLDIIQVGAATSSAGRRYFAAWGAGEPNGPDSAYTEVDLGPADTLAHKYTVQLLSGTWSLSIDGVTRQRVPDTFRTWQIRGQTVSHETEALDDPFGGTRWRPVSCSAARIYRTSWVLPAWSFYGSGTSAASAKSAQGSDWFRVWQ